MRIRFPELLDERGLTAYGLWSLAGGKKGPLTLSNIYRLVREKGAVNCFGADVLDAICDALDVGVSEVLTRDPAPRGSPMHGTPGRKKRAV
jgi:DNA-binding Xre family transcriptional regulator